MNRYKFKLHQQVRVLPGCIVGHVGEVRDITYRENFGREGYGLRGIREILFFGDELEEAVPAQMIEEGEEIER